MGNGYRAYSPALRRFTCPDSESPFGVGGINPYVYCDHDPVNKTDPSGHMPKGRLARVAAFAGENKMPETQAEGMSLGLPPTDIAGAGTPSSEQAATGTASETILVRNRAASENSQAWSTLSGGAVGGSVQSIARKSLPIQRKRPPMLNIKPTRDEPMFIAMTADNVRFVHGSTSDSLAGFQKFESLLSMEDIANNDWFKTHPLQSGERGYTKISVGKEQPIAQGVSMNNIQNYKDSLRYSTERAYARQGSFPVLYGISGSIPLNDKIPDHPLSIGSIKADAVVAIYVHPENRSTAAEMLSSSSELVSKLRDLIP
ncbi:hypothetical protein BME18_22975 [Klebsiella michiganensis]|nr:hypothetical protein BME18_22975 [Klebsiella michiganensis]